MSEVETPLPTEASAHAGPVDELRRLKAEKLQLEIHQLRKPWWKTPSSIGPLATIVGAVLALFWAVASGFFDVSRRELEVRRREVQNELWMLETRRDAQTRQFTTEAETQRQRISVLRRQLLQQLQQATQLHNDIEELRRFSESQKGEAAQQRQLALSLSAEIQRLRQGLSAADQPVITGTIFVEGSRDTATLTIEGLNFGKLRGEVHVWHDCSYCSEEVVVDLDNQSTSNGKVRCFNSLFSLEELDPTIGVWSDTRIVVGLSRVAMRALLAKRETMSRFGYFCGMGWTTIDVAISRTDEKSARIAVPEVKLWIVNS